MTTAISSETCSTISLLIILYLLLSIEACAVRGVAVIIASCNSLANGYTDEATDAAESKIRDGVEAVLALSATTSAQHAKLQRR